MTDNNKSESEVGFYRRGGHTHDGENSSLINLEKYSKDDIKLIQDQLGIINIDDFVNNSPSFPNGTFIAGTYYGPGDSVPPPTGATSPNTPSGLRLTTGIYITSTGGEQSYIDALWGVPNNQDPNSSRVKDYEVEIIKVGSGIIQSPARTQLTQHRFIPVEPGVQYGIRVRAIDNANHSSGYVPSTDYEYITAATDASVPSTPTGVTLFCGFKTATATWNDNSEDDVAKGAGSYHVQLATNNTFTTIIYDKKVSGTVTSFANLVTGTTYYIRVSAVDTSGNESSYSGQTGSTTGTTGQANGHDDIVAATITGDRIAANTIVAGNIAAATITSAEIAANTITANNLSVTQALNAHTLTLSSTGVMRAGSGTRASTEYQNLITAWGSNLKGYWKLTGASTTQADSSGNSRDGTLSGTYTTQVSGSLSNDTSNKAIKFGDGGGTNYATVTVSHNSAFNLTTAYTIEAWVYTRNDRSGNGQSIIVKGDGTTINYQMVMYKTGGNWRLWMGHTSDGGVVTGVINVFPSNKNMIDNGWNYVVLTYDGSYLKFYLNGVLDGAIPAASADTNSADILIGNNGGNSERQNGNDIDEVAIYNTALDAVEIKKHYDAAKNNFQYALFNANGIQFYHQGSSAFTGGTITADLSVATGSALFTGIVSGSALLGGVIIGGTITGTYIIGSQIATAYAGRRIQLNPVDYFNSSNKSSLAFYTGDTMIEPARIYTYAGETSPLTFSSQTLDNSGYFNINMYLQASKTGYGSPYIGINNGGPQFNLFGNQYADVDMILQVDGRIESFGIRLNYVKNVGGSLVTDHGSTLHSGNGAPTSTDGSNGDFWFRYDTPGTANQRLYVKSGGSWSGIL